MHPEFDRRNDFVGDREFEIGLGVQDLVGFRLVLGHRDFGLGCRLLAAAREDFRRLFTNDLVDEIGHDRLAVNLLQVRNRHLAGTEAIDADTILHLDEALVHPSLHFVGRDNDLEFALQPLSERFDNLHVKTFTSR